MKPVEKFIQRQTVSLPLMTAMFPVLYLGAEIGIVASGVVAAGTYIASNSTMKQFQFSSDSKKLGMTRSELKHIRAQVKDAKKKIKLLQSYYYRVRSIASFKQLLNMVRLANKIVSLVQLNPRKFYSAEPFFYSHLESAVELTEKYALLIGQPVKDMELKIALQETREMLHSMNEVMERDLKKVLSADVEKLRMELDYARMAVGQNETQMLLQETPTDDEGDVDHDTKSIESK